MAAFLVSRARSENHGPDDFRLPLRPVAACGAEGSRVVVPPVDLARRPDQEGPTANHGI